MVIFEPHYQIVHVGYAGKAQRWRNRVHQLDPLRSALNARLRDSYGIQSSSCPRRGYGPHPIGSADISLDFYLLERLYYHVVLCRQSRPRRMCLRATPAVGGNEYYSTGLIKHVSTCGFHDGLPVTSSAAFVACRVWNP